MALPGLEEHAHPGAKLLSQGWHFRTDTIPLGANTYHQLSAEPSHHVTTDPWAETVGGSLVHEHFPGAVLQWSGGGPGSGYKKGEIAMVETAPSHSHQGVASALYGMGRSMARLKPQHSSERTPEGDAWARSVSKRYGGRVPKVNTF